MGTTIGKKDIATTKSGHGCVTPPAMSLNPPTPPAGPVPVPYPYTARSATAKRTKRCLKVRGAEALVQGSVMTVDRPANQPSQPTGGDIVTHAVAGDATVTEGSCGTKAGGKPVSATGDNVRMNLMMPEQAVAQANVPLLLAGGTSATGGRRGKGAGSAEATKRALIAQSAKQCTKAGHPVDVATGYVVDEAVDLSLPGAIPLVWRRSYSSAMASERSALGRGGWVHSFDQWIEEGEQGTTLQGEDGRKITFKDRHEDGTSFHRGERLTLTSDRSGAYTVYDHATRLTRFFSPFGRKGRAVLRSIRDAYGHAIALEYEGERLIRMVDTAGRQVIVKNDRKGRVERIEVWSAAKDGAGRDAPVQQQWFEYAYHPAGELASAENALGHADRFAYDGLHRMVQTTLKNGVSFYYEYDESSGACIKTWGDGDLHTVELRIDVEKRITTTSGTHEPRSYTWNQDGLVVREATFGGDYVRERVYDKDQYLLSAANAAGEKTSYQYDARGNRTKIIDPAGNEATWEYDDDLPLRRIGPDGLVTTYVHDGCGALVGITYPSGISNALSYDREGRLEAIYGLDGLLAGFAYDAQHNVIQEVDARGARTKYTYDPLGRPLMRLDALGRKTSVHYDRLGQPIEVSFPDGTKTLAQYDPLGSVARFRDGAGHTTTMEYAGTGVLVRLEQADGQFWRFKYDDDERLVRIENPRCERYEFDYDWMGRVTEEKTFDGRYLQYTYSKAERLSRIEYPDHAWREFLYDPLGNVVAEHSPDGDIEFERDKLGRLRKAVLTEYSGKVVTVFERDKLGRVIAEKQNDRTIRYEYDSRGRRAARILPGGETTRYQYDPLGALVGVEHDGHKVSIERDVLGRERRKEVHKGRVDIRSVYDEMDRLKGQQVLAPSPAGGDTHTVLSQRRWSYDAVGRAWRIDDERRGPTLYRYDSIGQLIEAQHGKLKEVFEYDPTGSLQNVLRDLGQVGRVMPWDIQPGNLLTRTPEARYDNDERGRRVRKIVFAKGGDPYRGQPLRGNEVTEYAWDCRDRLREVLLPSGERVRYTYDAFARRVRKEVVPAERADFAGMVRLALEKGTEALPKSRVVEFLWDGDVLAADIDLRAAVKFRAKLEEARAKADAEPASAPGRRSWNPRKPFEEPTWAPGMRVFVHEPGTFVPMLQGEQGAVFTYVNDHLGMPKELIDQDGRVAWAAIHSAWGRVLEVWRDPKTKLKVESPFRLLGQYADEETGHCYTRFRYFDADAGRWLSADPLGAFGGDNVFGLNVAPSTGGDPLGLMDARSRGYPYGFKSYGQFNQFGEATRAGLSTAGYPGTVPIMQGSAVTGVSHDTGKSFDIGRRSDLDVALAGSAIYAKAVELGLAQGGRARPLDHTSEAEIEALGLTQLRTQMSRLAGGREVNFMIYENEEGALAKSKASMAFPGGKC